MRTRQHQAGVVSLIGFGRKAEKPRPHVVSAMLDDETFEAVRREAARTGESVSVLIQKILRRDLIREA